MSLYNYAAMGSALNDCADATPAFIGFATAVPTIPTTQSPTSTLLGPLLAPSRMARPMQIVPSRQFARNSYHLGS